MYICAGQNMSPLNFQRTNRPSKSFVQSLKGTIQSLFHIKRPNKAVKLSCFVPTDGINGKTNVKSARKQE